MLNMFLKAWNHFQALTLLLINCGYRKTLKIIIKWPSYVMMPMFSIFIFSTERIGNRKLLVCSTRWTLVNVLITMGGLIFGALFLYLVVDSESSEFFIIIATPLMFVAIIFYTILLTAESCTCTCKCGPYIKRSGLDIETLEIVDLGHHDLHSRLQTLVNSL